MTSRKVIITTLAVVSLLSPFCSVVAAQEDVETDPQDQRSNGAGGSEQKSDLAEFPPFRFHGEDFNLQLGGRFVLDAARYSHANDRRSGFEFDDARLILEGNTGSFHWLVEPDLIGTDTPRHMYEAWGRLDVDAALRLTAGQFRVALGSEFATREEHLPLAGYGFTSYLDGRYDVGVRADGNLVEESLWYEATATIGSGFDLEGHRRQNPQYSFRFVGHPSQWILPDSEFLSGLFAGGALAHSPDGDEPIVVTTPFESVVFRTRDLDGSAARWRHIELGYSTGPVRIGWERVVGSYDNVPVGGGREEDMDQLTAWSLYGSWNITGEEQIWDRGRWAGAPVSARAGAQRTESGEPEPDGIFSGRWEFAARHSNADMDRDLFLHALTGYDPSTQEVRTFSLDLNWYPEEWMRLALGWVKTIADHELSTFGGTNRDSSFLMRLALEF